MCTSTAALYVRTFTSTMNEPSLCLQTTIEHLNAQVDELRQSFVVLSDIVVGELQRVDSACRRRCSEMDTSLQQALQVHLDSNCADPLLLLLLLLLLLRLAHLTSNLHTTAMPVHLCHVLIRQCRPFAKRLLLWEAMVLEARGGSAVANRAQLQLDIDFQRHTITLQNRTLQRGQEQAQTELRSACSDSSSGLLHRCNLTLTKTQLRRRALLLSHGVSTIWRSSLQHRHSSWQRWSSSASQT
jgi:hypothetical protein